MTASLFEELEKTWAAACEHEGVPASVKFVEFGQDNPHLPRLNKLVKFFNAAKCQQRMAAGMGI